MRCDKMEPGTALEEGLRLPYALIRCLSEVTLGAAPAAVDMEELIEARFFDSRCEIRLFYRNGSLSAARVEEEPGDKIVKKEYKLTSPKGTLTEYFCLDAETDADGQVFVSAVRLAGWREGE